MAHVSHPVLYNVHTQQTRHGMFASLEVHTFFHFKLEDSTPIAFETAPLCPAQA